MNATGGGRGTNQRRVRGQSVGAIKRAMAPTPARLSILVETSVPALTFENQQWDWKGERPMGRADRMFRDYRSCVPPFIDDIDIHPSRTTSEMLNEAAAAIGALESDPNVRYAGVAGALLRSESVGSSKIERLDVDARKLGLAAIDETRSRSDASQAWSNVQAMTTAINAAVRQPITVNTVHSIHHVLMKDDPFEQKWAGRFRDMPSWIGGSDNCPRDAIHVPPSPDRVPHLMADLAGWCNRSDVQPIMRAAIAHAQFETIHPYTDGNGRTGRAIIHTILRRSEMVTASIVPTSAALLADVNGYFDSLGAYRAGDTDAYLQHFSSATTRASREAQQLGADLKEISADWHQRARLRPGTVADFLARGLIQQPVISADNNPVTGMTVKPSTIYRAIDTLVDGGILTEITEGKRNRAWAAIEVTSALDEFGRRVGRRQLGWQQSF